MAAAQVAKKLKDRRQKHTLEEIFRKVLSLVITVNPLPMISIFRKVDKDGSGTISLGEYFGIFEEHGINLSKSEAER